MESVDQLVAKAKLDVAELKDMPPDHVAAQVKKEDVINTITILSGLVNTYIPSQYKGWVTIITSMLITGVGTWWVTPVVTPVTPPIPIVKTVNLVNPDYPTKDLSGEILVVPVGTTYKYNDAVFNPPISITTTNGKDTTVRKLP